MVANSNIRTLVAKGGFMAEQAQENTAPDFSDLIKIGKKRIASGQISIGEAKAQAKAMGLPVQDDIASSAAADGQIQPSLFAMQNYSPKSPMDMNAGGNLQDRLAQTMGIPLNENNLPSSDATPTETNKTPGAFAHTDFGFQKHTGSKETTNNLLTPEQYAQGKETFENQPDVQSLRSGDQNLQNILSLLVAKKGADPGWIKPLLALADSQTGSKLMEGYTSGMTAQEKMQLMLKYTDELQKRKADLVRLGNQGISSMKNGSTLTNTLDQIIKQNESSGFKNATMDPAQRIQDQAAYRGHAQNVLAAKKDPVLNDMFGRYRVVNDAISNLTNAHNLTPQQFHESQQAIRTALFPKGVQSGIDERAKNYIENSGYGIDNIVQMATGEPANISQNDPDIRHIEELAVNMKQNFKEGARNRLDFVTSGQGWIYDDPRYAHLADSLKKELETGNAQFKPTSNAQKGLNMRQAPGATNLRPLSAVGKQSSGGLPSGFDIDAEIARRKAGK